MPRLPLFLAIALALAAGQPVDARMPSPRPTARPASAAPAARPTPKIQPRPRATQTPAPRATSRVPTVTPAKDVVRRLYEEVWNRGNLGALSQLLAMDFEDHPLEGAQAPGPAGFKSLVAELLAAFPDARFTLRELIAEDGRVVARFVLSGTHLGAFRGVPASGRRVQVEGVDIYRVEGGRLKERWGQLDMQAIVAQIESGPEPMLDEDSPMLDPDPADPRGVE